MLPLFSEIDEYGPELDVQLAAVGLLCRDVALRLPRHRIIVVVVNSGSGSSISGLSDAALICSFDVQLTRLRSGRS